MVRLLIRVGGFVALAGAAIYFGRLFGEPMTMTANDPTIKTGGTVAAIGAGLFLLGASIKNAGERRREKREDPRTWSKKKKKR